MTKRTIESEVTFEGEDGTKLCINCKWCRISSIGPEYATCEAPANRILGRARSLIDGKETEHPQWRFKFCSTHRPADLLGAWPFSIMGSICGNVGRWWTAKEETAARTKMCAEMAGDAA